MRQIILDTETTGLDIKSGHRVIEIGCIEVINRRITGKNFHTYLNPNRAVDKAAFEVHGLSDNFLSTQPSFGEIVSDFLDFIKNTELVIHNASFDLSFLNSEMSNLNLLPNGIEEICDVLDTLKMARDLHPGQRNSLDALCKRYNVDSSKRELHGALLDAEILAEVFLAMTGGQDDLLLGDIVDEIFIDEKVSPVTRPKKSILKVRNANLSELEEHSKSLDIISDISESKILWPK
jgi:DNA polymerase-3 subunit epsilon